MRNDLTELIATLAELQGRSTEIIAHLREDARLLTEVQRELLAAQRDLWAALQEVQQRPWPTNHLPPAAPRMLRIADVLKRVGLGRSSIWRMVKDGEFPPPLRRQ